MTDQNTTPLGSELSVVAVGQTLQIRASETSIVVDDRTANLDLPLPSPHNTLEVDVSRVRDSLSGIDRAVGAVGTALIGVTNQLAQKADATSVTEALGTKADATELLAQEARTTAALSLKADATTVTSELALKADADANTVAHEQLASDVSAVDAALALKADVSAVDAALALKADRTKTVAASIATAWTGTAPPYTQTLSVAGVTATSIAEVTLPATATQEHLLAYRALDWTDGGQASNTLTLRAWGTINTTEIPITVIIRG